MKLRKILALVLSIVMIAGLLCACGEDEAKKVATTDNPEEFVKLRWYIANSYPIGYEEVMEEANKYLKEKLNVELDLVCVESADYDAKVQLALASNEEFDLVWTSNWKFNYEANILKGAFMPLSQYINSPELADLKNFYSEGIWEAATVGGEIYGVPMQQVMYNQKGCNFDKEYLDKYGYTNYYDQVHDFDELTDLYQTIHDGEKDDSSFFITSSNQTDYFIPEKTQVTSGWEIVDGVVTDRREEYDEYRYLMRDWNQRGFFPPTAGTNTSNDNTKILSGYTRYLPGVEAKANITSDKEIVIIPTTEPYMGRNGVQSTLTSVSTTSKNPIRALKLIYLTHTDEYLLNLLCYGIEGRDYTIIEGSNPKRMERASDSFYIGEFKIGNQFLAYLAPMYDDDVWEETDRENKAAFVDPNIGFSFDPKSVESEIAQVSAVMQEYKPILVYGLNDPDVSIPEYYDKLELAGYNTIKDEIQRQYDEWKSAQ